MKLAILGGGQLGKMFLQEATDYPMPVAVLDPDPRAPCAALTGLFKQGDFRDKQTVLDFAKDADAVGIEIEHVSVEALEALEEAGKRVIPAPRVLRLRPAPTLTPNASRCRLCRKPAPAATTAKAYKSSSAKKTCTNCGTRRQ